MEEVYDPKKLSDNDIDYEMEESLENKNKILEDLDTIQNPENNEFIKFLTSIENCYLCIDGDLSGVPHKCFICDKRVHLVTECSQSFELENSASIRVCTVCSKGGDLKEIITLREFENWRNKGKENENIQKKGRKRKALYLGENKCAIMDKISHEKHATIPILKNASCMDLASIKLDGKRVTLTNTCAFDSIFHLLLTASYDFETFSMKVDLLKEGVGLFQMIDDVRRTGLSNTSYIMRAKILKQFQEIQTHPNIAEFFLLDCATNVGTLARRLLKDVPSFEEISICERGCPPRKKYFPIFSISRRELLCENRENLIENCISLDNSSPCTIADCDGRVNAQLMTSRLHTDVKLSLISIMQCS
ncbi:hypothetical protein JTB14_028286 [Gonioctena quinquepunctata]|nr:hypothetical protein JTB14_028286 [Gonioctena quinquepunctata]